MLYGGFNTRNVDFKYGYYDRTSRFGFTFAGMFKESEKADLRSEHGDYNWTENIDNLWKDCNCINCRLARIEDNINKMIQIMDNFPPEYMKSPDELSP